MNLFNNGVEQGSESRVGEMRSCIQTYRLINDFASTEDALLEGAAPVVFLVFQFIPDLSSEMLGKERGGSSRELRHTGKFERVKQVVAYFGKASGFLDADDLAVSSESAVFNDD